MPACRAAALPRRLGELIDLSDSIKLSNTHFQLAALPFEQGSMSAESVVADFLESRSAMVRSIARSFRPAAGHSNIRLPDLVCDDSGTLPDFGPYLRFYAAHQRDLEFRVRNLQDRVRFAVEGLSPRLARLVSLEKALDRTLLAQHRLSFSRVPRLLEQRFLVLAEGEGTDEALLLKCRQDMQSLLLAEADARLLPVLGPDRSNRRRTHSSRIRNPDDGYTMIRILIFCASALGAAAILWTCAEFIGNDSLAFAITLVIGAVYVIGLVELARFRHATASLTHALERPPTDAEHALEDWLAQLHPSLSASTRLRIGGQPVGLPAPVLTPYLVGLLVMLGLLGTFAGMVETLGGAVIALEGSTELAAIRNGLAAPIEGLGMAFGTSVAGVAASAMLGLNATLCRRERLMAVRTLDNAVGSHFRQYSLAYQQQATFTALQAQSAALPAVAEQLSAIGQRLESMGERLEQVLVEQQSGHLQSQQAQFSALADTVAESLNTSLASSGRLAGDSLRPVMTEAMADIRNDIQASQQQYLEQQAHSLSQLREQSDTRYSELREQLINADQQRFEQLRSDLESLHDSHQAQQLDSQASFVTALEDTSQTLQKQVADNAGALHSEFRDMLGNVQPALQSAAGQFASLLSSTEELVAARQQAEHNWQHDQEQRLAELSQNLASELGQLRAAEGKRADAAVARLAELEAVVTDHLARLGSALEAPMARLIETAAETPAAAAEVITALRSEISQNLERDNALLAERNTLVEQPAYTVRLPRRYHQRPARRPGTNGERLRRDTGGHQPALHRRIGREDPTDHRYRCRCGRQRRRYCRPRRCLQQRRGNL